MPRKNFKEFFHNANPLGEYPCREMLLTARLLLFFMHIYKLLFIHSCLLAAVANIDK